MACCPKGALNKLSFFVVLSYALASDTLENIRQNVYSEKPKGIEASSSLSTKESGPELEHSYTADHSKIYESHSRQLKQRENAQQNAEEFNCSLSEDVIGDILDERTGVWTLNESLLEQNVSIIQAAINCASDNDVILLSTGTMLQPSNTIVVARNLTLSADPGGSLIQDGEIIETDSKVRMTCPIERDLLSIRGSVRIANIIFAECGSASNIVSLDITCETGESSTEVHLQHVEFQDNVLSGDKWLIESAIPSCTHLALQNVGVVRNRCGRMGCVSLASVNTLTDVRLKRNGPSTSSNDSQGIFNSSVGSTTTATRISSARNQIRIFDLFNSTLSISDSLFRGNGPRNAEPSSRLSDGGSVRLSNQSRVTITTSQFEGNSGANGGALFALDSEITIQLCTFRRNNANGGNGGSVSARAGSTVFLMGTNFSSNKAQYGGACDFEHSRVTMRNLTFQSNEANGEDGGAVYNVGGEIIGDNLRFFGNTAASNGGGLYCQFTPHAVLSNTEFQNNTGSYGGAISVFNSDLELGPSCAFITNRGIQDGGSIHVTNSTTSISFSYFQSNRANTGGSMWIDQHSHSNIENSNFTNGKVASNGGAIHLTYASNLDVSNSVFSRNRARGRGGALFLTNLSNSTISTCSFGNNRGTLGGGAISAYSNSMVSISNANIYGNEGEEGGGISINNSNSTMVRCNLTQNSATSSGGAIYGYRGVMELSGGRLFGNRALDGAGIALSRMYTIKTVSALFQHNHANGNGGAMYIHDTLTDTSISKCSFSTNHAANGSALFLDNLSARISTSRFRRNNASHSGAGLYLTESNLTMRRSVLLSNWAGSCAGVCVHFNSTLRGKNLTFRSNVAFENGGGIGVESHAYCLCRSCEFRNNIAFRGAGLYASSENPMDLEDQLRYASIVAQLQDSIFERNNASEYGGGIYLHGPQNGTTNCTDLSIPCGRIVLLNTSFNDNIASYGSSLLTTHLAGVLISCSYSDQERYLLDNNKLKELSIINPDMMCTSWQGKTVSGDFNGDVIGTYGVKWNFSINSKEEARIVHEDLGFVLENLRTGVELPVINISMLGAFGYRPMLTTPDTIEVVVSSHDGYFPGNVTLSMIGGNGTLSGINTLNKPGNYTLDFLPTGVALSSGTLQIRVSDCRLGEALTSGGELCEECDALSYNFNPKNGKCIPCPSDASCGSTYIVPNDGYWHQSPCHAKVMRCLNEEACKKEQRQDKVANFTQEFSDCDMDDTIIMSYHEILCRQGYEGPLCGSCQKDHGLTLEFHCSKCPHNIFSLVTILFVGVYLMVVASFTIRGSLPGNTTIISQSSRPISLSNVECSSVRSASVSVEMVETTRTEHMPVEVINPNSPTSTSDEEDAGETMDLEITRWIKTETLKILINFLQVTSIAATINVQWTEGVLTMFEASELVGALTTAALSRPIDCFLGTRSSTARSIWRTLVGLLVPGTVVGVFTLFWGYKAIRGSEGIAFFWKRALLSIIAVTYISYLGLTKLAVRVFYCVDIYDSEDPFSNSQTTRWAVDTSIKCYGKNHSGLIAIGIVVLLVVTISFPLLFTFVIVKNKSQADQRKGWMFETMGFLYRAFKEKFVFWECVAMLRKACLSIIVVFSYPLGSLAQGLLAQIVLVLSICAHLKCLPYREELHRLNSYEFGSLLVSCLTFLLGQFFGDDKSGQFAKGFVAFLIVSMNISFSLFLVSVLLVSGLDHIRVVLKSEGFLVDDNTPAWKVIKVYVVSRIGRCCGSST